MRHLYIIMGPAGCGKSSIARSLSTKTGWTMIEADDHHSDANIEKQRAGLPLTDDDRADWIDSMVAAVNGSDQTYLVLACSALTPYVQSRLRDEITAICHWVMIEVTKEELSRRVSQRAGHFMPASLVEDQLAALSIPVDAIKINGEQSLDRISNTILEALDLSHDASPS